MRLSCFDLDRTLLTVNSSFVFCKHLCKAKILRQREMIRSYRYAIAHRFFGLSLSQLHREVFSSVLYGVPLALLVKYAQAFVDERLNQLVYLPAWERLQWARHRGDYVCILSSSPDFLVQCIAKKLQVDSWEASRYVADDKGNLCAIEHVLLGKGKAWYVQKICERLGILPEKSIAYSDSYLDLPFLRAAGTAIAVNPDSRLLAVANQLGWEKM